MAFFDQDLLDTVTDRLASAGRVISEKAKEVTDSAKTSLQIAQEEKRLRTAYRVLGMYVYEKSGIEADEGMAPYFEEIRAAKTALEELKKGGASGSEEAPGPEADKADRPGDNAEQEADGQVCPACGNVISAQLLYCPRCGHKLK